MTYTPVIHDWRPTCAPIDQLFRAGGQAVAGGMTLGGVSVENPEPGGRAELLLNFAAFVTEETNLDASWTVSRILNGSVMRIRLWNTVQLVSEEALNVPDIGQEWANGQPWANDENWRANPFALVTATALAGASSFTVDMSVIGQVLKVGHVIGFLKDGYDFAHMVLDIEYSSGVATVTVEPPLRRDLAADDLMLFRPSMLVTCRNAREVAGNFARGRTMAFGAARMVEALV